MTKSIRVIQLLSQHLSLQNAFGKNPLSEALKEAELSIHTLSTETNSSTHGHLPQCREVAVLTGNLCCDLRKHKINQ